MAWDESCMKKCINLYDAPENILSETSVRLSVVDRLQGMCFFRHLETFPLNQPRTRLIRRSYQSSHPISSDLFSPDLISSALWPIFAVAATNQRRQTARPASFWVTATNWVSSQRTHSVQMKWGQVRWDRWAIRTLLDTTESYVGLGKRLDLISRRKDRVCSFRIQPAADRNDLTSQPSVGSKDRIETNGQTYGCNRLLYLPE